MRVEVTYFADDDTEFDTEAECREYEDLFRAQLDAVVFFDQSYRQLDSFDEIESYAGYMYIKDGDKANALFPRLEQYISFCKPDWEVSTGDILHWDDDGDLVDLRNQLMELTQEIEMIEREAKKS